jgi:hypothetical protein
MRWVRGRHGLRVGGYGYSVWYSFRTSAAGTYTATVTGGTAAGAVVGVHRNVDNTMNRLSLVRGLDRLAWPCGRVGCGWVGGAGMGVGVWATVGMWGSWVVCVGSVHRPVCAPPA